MLPKLAQELRLCASAGDRALILAPQRVDYIVAFLGALQAGLIAVPLLVPLGGRQRSACCFGAARRVAEGELFIISRIKDLLIVYGRNHSPDDIEATIQEITRGRCVAIAVPNDDVEKLVAIIELKTRGDSDEDAMGKLGVVKREVTSAISTSHGLSVADLVLVSPGSIPITTSGNVRRAECVQLYRDDEFTRIDA